jgi:hypothetical protein
VLVERPFAETAPELTLDVRPVGSPVKLCLIKLAIGEAVGIGAGV